MATLKISDDRFRLEREIGRGGFGVVYLAEDTVFGGKVAVKILDPGTTSDSSFLRSLMIDEARLQAAVSPQSAPHRNLVYIIDVRSFGDNLGIAMEYVDGGSISELLGTVAKPRLLPASQALDLVLQACQGLAAAHDKNVIHRDIKPRNLLLRKADGVVKIADWGVAKNIEIAGKGQTYAGTPPYMSPEVIILNRLSRPERLKNTGVDHRTDIYSLGVTIFEMLTGDFPFDGEDLILQGVTKRQERFLIEMGVEPALSNIILKAMARRPEDRYQSAVELKKDLQHWQNIYLSAADLKAAWDFYSGSHDAKAAEKRFLETLARYPSNPQAYLEIGRFYIQCSREDNAIEVLSRGIAVAPDYGQLWDARGRLYAKRKSPLAAEDLQRALDLELPAKEKQQIRSMLKRLSQQ